MVQDVAKPTRILWKTRKVKVLRNQPKSHETSESAGNVMKFAPAKWREVSAPEESIIKAKMANINVRKNFPNGLPMICPKLEIPLLVEENSPRNTGTTPTRTVELVIKYSKF